MTCERRGFVPVEVELRYGYTVDRVAKNFWNPLNNLARYIPNKYHRSSFLPKALASHAGRWFSSSLIFRLSRPSLADKCATAYREFP